MLVDVTRFINALLRLFGFLFERDNEFATWFKEGSMWLAQQAVTLAAWLGARALEFLVAVVGLALFLLQGGLLLLVWTLLGAGLAEWFGWAVKRGAYWILRMMTLAPLFFVTVLFVVLNAALVVAWSWTDDPLVALAYGAIFLCGSIGVNVFVDPLQIIADWIKDMRANSKKIEFTPVADEPKLTEPEPATPTPVAAEPAPEPAPEPEPVAEPVPALTPAPVATVPAARAPRAARRARQPRM